MPIARRAAKKVAKRAAVRTAKRKGVQIGKRTVNKRGLSADNRLTNRLVRKGLLPKRLAETKRRVKIGK